MVQMRQVNYIFEALMRSDDSIVVTSDEFEGVSWLRGVSHQIVYAQFLEHGGPVYVWDVGPHCFGDVGCDLCSKEGDYQEP